MREEEDRRLCDMLILIMESFCADLPGCLKISVGAGARQHSKRLRKAIFFVEHKSYKVIQCALQNTQALVHAVHTTALEKAKSNQ